MAHDTVQDDAAARTERRSAAVVGALAGAGALVTVMPFFFPLGVLLGGRLRRRPATG